MTMFIKITSRIPRIFYYTCKRLLQFIGGLLFVGSITVSLVLGLAYISQELQQPAVSLGILILFLLLFFSFGMAKIDLTPKHKILKAVGINFLILCGGLAALAGVGALVFMLLQLSQLLTGSPGPAGWLIILAVIIGFCYAMARLDVHKENLEQGRVLDRLSEE